MSKLLWTILLFFCLALPIKADQKVAQGYFDVVNTEGFTQENGVRTPLPVDTKVGSARIEQGSDGGLRIDVDGTRFDLFPLEDGLAALEWNADGTSLLHAIDIQALLDKTSKEDVPAWGANLAWPGAGKVRFVLLPLGDGAYAGFLISHPGDRTVVRQMEFRQVTDRSSRPASGRSGSNNGS